jgi:hypothetical protein
MGGAKKKIHSRKNYLFSDFDIFTSKNRYSFQQIAIKFVCGVVFFCNFAAVKN